MKTTVYKICQRLFGYREAAPNTSVAYARAIQDCLQVIKEVYAKGDRAVDEYANLPYARRLTLEFLDGFFSLASSKSESEYINWSFLDSTITLDSDLHPSFGRAKVIIKSPSLLSATQEELILLGFGAPRDLRSELGVWRTLTETGTVEPPLPRQLKTITYWNLRDATADSVAFSSVPVIDREIVLATCSQLLQEKRDRRRV